MKERPGVKSSLQLEVARISRQHSIGKHWTYHFHLKVGAAPLNLVLPSLSFSVMIGLAAGLNLWSFEYLSTMRPSASNHRYVDERYLLAWRTCGDCNCCWGWERRYASQNRKKSVTTRATRFQIDGGEGLKRGSSSKRSWRTRMSFVGAGREFEPSPKRSVSWRLCRRVFSVAMKLRLSCWFLLRSDMMGAYFWPTHRTQLGHGTPATS